jgi:ribosomal protein S18 acetylase RimI-like enzyme
MPINQDSKSVAAEPTTSPELIPDTKSTTEDGEEERDALKANTVYGEEPTLQFSNESNKEELSTMILSWLMNDFVSQTQKIGEKPENHFGHDIDTIKEIMQKADILVLSNAQGLVGYLIWSVVNLHHISIEFMEVSSEYRGKGLARRMIDALIQHLPEVNLLSSMSADTPTAKGFHQHLGWQNNGKTNYFHKIIRPGLESSQTLPTTGLALSICPYDFYEVHRNLKDYLPKMQYFKLEMGPDGKLLVPIISEFKFEGYIGVHHNGKLIEAGKAKHLFDSEDATDFHSVFLMIKFNPINKKKYENLSNTGSTSPNTPQNRDPITAANARGTAGFFRERDPEEAIVQAARSQPRGL